MAADKATHPAVKVLLGFGFVFASVMGIKYVVSPVMAKVLPKNTDGTEKHIL